MIIIVTVATEAETCVCVWAVVCVFFFASSNSFFSKQWWRRYDKLDAIVYTIQIDVHVFCLLFMAIPYLLKAIKISQTVAKII